MATERQIAANRANRRLWRGHTADGLNRLQEAAIRNRPWLRSTGPRTEAGKDRSKLNALKHGGFSADVLTGQRIVADLMKKIMAAVAVPKIRKVFKAKVPPKLKKEMKAALREYRLKKRSKGGIRHWLVSTGREDFAAVPQSPNDGRSAESPERT